MAGVTGHLGAGVHHPLPLALVAAPQHARLLRHVARRAADVRLAAVTLLSQSQPRVSLVSSNQRPAHLVVAAVAAEGEHGVRRRLEVGAGPRHAGGRGAHPHPVPATRQHSLALTPHFY